MAQTNGELEHSKGSPSSPGPSIPGPGLGVCPTKLTMSTETPEQLTNGNHHEETQEEDNTGGMSFPVAVRLNLVCTCY